MNHPTMNYLRRALTVAGHVRSETLVHRNGVVEELAKTASDRLQQKQDARDREREEVNH